MSIGGFFHSEKTNTYTQALQIYEQLVISPMRRVHCVGYWPFHIFKSGKRATPVESYMHIDYIAPDGFTAVSAYLCVWQGKNCPDKQPSHIIVLLENNEKKYDIGKCPMLTSKDQVRILPRSTGKKDKTFCFAVGRDYVHLFSSFIMPFCIPIIRKETKFTGVTIKPIDGNDNSGEE